MELKKILVAVDGSGGSNQALKYGADLAKNYDGELTIVHVMHREGAPSVSYGSVGGYSSAELMREQLEKTKKNKVVQGETLLKQAEARVAPFHVKVHTELREGEPEDSICQYAKTNHIDLIVIGNRGLSGLKKLVMGSVSQKVAQNAPCPVFIAK